MKRLMGMFVLLTALAAFASAQTNPFGVSCAPGGGETCWNNQPFVVGSASVSVSNTCQGCLNSQTQATSPAFSVVAGVAVFGCYYVVALSSNTYPQYVSGSGYAGLLSARASASWYMGSEYWTMWDDKYCGDPPYESKFIPPPHWC